jgi:metal-responsive CopG/Arc/MetJ family transcriptional regulator
VLQVAPLEATEAVQATGPKVWLISSGHIITHNMNTIAVTFDPPTLERLDALVKDLGRNRSELVREAVRQFLERERTRREEEQQAKVIHRHRRRLAVQAAALVREQGRR